MDESEVAFPSAADGSSAGGSNRPKWGLRAGGNIAAMGLLVVISAILVITLGGKQEYVNLLMEVVVFLILAQGFNLIAGYGGLLAVGNVMFFGLGAYVVGVGWAHGWYPPLAGCVIGVAGCALLAYPLGRVFVRLGGVLFALVTFALTLMLGTVLSLVSAFGGASGPQLPLIVSSMGLGRSILYLYSNSPSAYLIAGFVVVAVVAALTIWFERSFWGHRVTAARDDAVLARTSGVSVERNLSLTWAASAAISALAGVLFVQSSLSVSPSYGFGIGTSTEMLVPALAGGIGTVFGPPVGSVVLLAAGLLRNWSSSVSAANWSELAYGCILLLIVVRAPDGAVGWLINRSQTKRERLVLHQRRQQPTEAEEVRRRAAIADLCNIVRPTPERDDEGLHAVLKVSGVGKEFGGVRALNDISFSVWAGEVVALIGPNGAGKSTIIGCITGTIKPSRGAIEFDGVSITRSSPERIARLGIARTYQSLKVFLSRSVSDNILVSLLSSGMRREDALNRVSLALRAFGLEGIANVRTSALSMADQRLVELARAVGSGASLILLDEAMVGLSREDGEKILELVRKLSNAGVAFIVVEHTMGRITPIATRVIVTHRGTVMADGKVREVLGRPDVAEAYFGVLE
jgi:ABC-type branched-subunit amino acid transport system ATPase component/ABC-type branched-subunit amino acid transport system permease subunit